MKINLIDNEVKADTDNKTVPRNRDRENMLPGFANFDDAREYWDHGRTSNL